ncbi:MAG TPA: diguanylate cyclase [Candidatus Krumholzibacteria bacterium]|nr:diguanylate cyclase [Candidatus Krumholzibacteria bacterium]
MLRPLRRIQKSFSAKITLLVGCSVVLTSFVVGLATTHSTGAFLTDRMTDRFPSTLTTTVTRLRLWHGRQSAELERLARSETLRLSAQRAASGPVAARASATAQVDYFLRLVQPSYPVYEQLLVLGPDGRLLASTAESPAVASDEAAQAWTEIGENGFEPGASRPLIASGRVHQWLYVTLGDSAVAAPKRSWLVARIDLERIAVTLEEVRLGAGGDLFLLDDQGRFITQPRTVGERMIGTVAMQVPTRQEGPVLVERRSRFDGKQVFHSKVHVDEIGGWLAYEEDYALAMTPVLEAQQRIWVAVLVVGAIAILAALRIAQSILKPIHGLALGAQRINEGLVGVKIPKGAPDEIGMMIDTFNEMAMKITLSQAELQYKNKMLNTQNDRLQDMNVRLEELSVTDGLTGLFNHRHFWNLMNTELARVDLQNGDLALILLDLDDFKRVNDKFGHAVGDQLLLTVANVLGETIRDTDIVARYGGEEFAVLLPDTDESGAQQVAEKIRASVEAVRFNVTDTDIVLKVTVSIGVSVFRGNRREFFNAADRALYQSKAAGKNCVHCALT